ncbi:hypothetical protein [Streptomyces sp. cg35]|uniref:hypothetical protein n=1 Tax=Streptomyces sp. cg35 TaxID=3421650 RepID=UPI003D181333
MAIVTGTSYTATGLDPATEYTVTVKAMRGDVEGAAASADFTTKGNKAPAKPTTVAIKTGPTTAGALISYASSGTPAATKFELQRKPKSGGSYKTVATSAAASDRELTDPGPLTTGTTYQWRVRAFNGDSLPADSDAVEGTPTAPALATPAPVQDGTPTTTGFAVKWPAVEHADATKGDKGYDVGITPTGPTVSAVDVTDPANPKVTVTGAQAGTSYSLSVKALGDGTNYTDSAIGTRSVNTAAQKLTKPVPVKKGNASNSGFSVEWPAVANVDATKGDKGYALDITPTGPTLGAVDVTDPAKPFVAVTGASPGTAYTVGVVAKGNTTQYTDSDKGTVAVSTTAAKLTKPVPVQDAEPTATELTAKWPKVANVDATKGDKGYTVTVTPAGPTVGAVDVTTDANNPKVALTGATAATEYTVSVVAKGNTTNYTDSDAGTVALTTAAAK